MNNVFIETLISNIGFISIAALLWGLIIVSGISFVVGLLRKSWKAHLLSGLTFIVPGIVLSTQQGYYSLFLLLPLIAFVLAFLIKKTS